MGECACEALEITAEKTREDLASDRILSLALVRLLEVLGEAARRVPPEIRQIHPDIPWAAIIGMRDRLIHGYDQVDLDIVWAVVKSDLPMLRATLERIATEAD